LNIISIEQSGVSICWRSAAVYVPFRSEPSLAISPGEVAKPMIVPFGA
jgi:hypothetical protein